MLPGDMVCLDVWVPSRLRWRPGQHAFLRFHRKKLLDHHPFTVESLPRKSSLGVANEKGGGANVMTFFVRAQSRLTRQLLDQAASNPHLQITTVVDGPYGT